MYKGIENIYIEGIMEKNKLAIVLHIHIYIFFSYMKH